MEFFSLKHAAMFLRVTPERLRALIKTGQAAATRRGRGYVLELAEITRLAELEAARQERYVYGQAGWLAEFTERVETFRWLRELAEQRQP